VRGVILVIVAALAAAPVLAQSTVWRPVTEADSTPTEGAWDRPAPISPRGILPINEQPVLAAEALGLTDSPNLPPPAEASGQPPALLPADVAPVLAAAAAGPSAPPPAPTLPPDEKPDPGLPLVIDFGPAWVTAWVPYDGSTMTPAVAAGGVAMGELRARLPLPDDAGLHAGIRARLPVEVGRAVAGKAVRVSIMARPLPGAPGVGLAVSLAGPAGDSGWFHFDPPTGPTVLTARIALPADEIGSGLLSLGIWPDVGGTGGGVLVEAVKLDLADASAMAAAPQPAMSAPLVLGPPKSAQTVTVETQPVAPAPKPSAAPKPVAAPKTVSPAVPAPAPSPRVAVSQPDSAPGRWAAHLASYKTLARAQRGWRELTATTPALAGHAPHYEPLDLPDGRHFIRVLAGDLADHDAAQALCTRTQLPYCKPMELTGKSAGSAP
jgi:hypothetical protein